MRTVIRQLFDIITAPEYDNLKNTEIVQLAFILEISNGRDANSSEYQTFLSDDQRVIMLSLDEQHEIVCELMQMIENDYPVSVSLMGAISKAKPEVILDHVQDFILNNYTKMEDYYIYQSIITIQNGTFSEDRNVLAKLKFNELKAMFEILSHYPDHIFTVSEAAKNCLSHLDTILNEIGG